MALPIKNFYGEIDGKTIYDFSRKLNFRLKTEKERIEHLNSLLINKETSQPHEFFNKVFEQKFDEKIDKDKAIYVEDVDHYMFFNDLVEWCKSNNKSIYKYLDVTDDDIVQYYNSINDDLEEEYEEKEQLLEYSNKRERTRLNISPIKLILNKQDNIYSETNIAKELEKMADYILFSPLREREEKVEYKIYRDSALFNKILKETSIDNSQSQELNDNTIHILLEKGQNYKKSIEQKITKKDIEENNIIADYQKAIDYITYELQKISKLENIYGLTNGFNNLEKLTDEHKQIIKLYNIELTLEFYKDMQRKKGLLQKHKALYIKDQLDVKDMINGTIYFKQPLADSCEIDWEQFDMFDEQHILALLNISPKAEDFQRDINCMIYDLENIINKCEFNERDREIIKMYRTGATQTTIAKVLNISQPVLNRILKRIAKDIMNKYEEQLEDWYYLNIVKGKYKTCSKCGKVKLLTERNFAKNKSSKDGFRKECKCCRKQDKKVA